MNIEITDQWLGTRTIGDKQTDLIKDQLKLLNYFKNDGRIPSQLLLDDIACYEKILNSQDPDLIASEYFEWKEDKPINTTVSKFGKHKGWIFNI